MSRRKIPLGPTTTIIYGEDHAIGNFFDIIDLRFANCHQDVQGEGYVFEYSDLFGISTNLIDVSMEDLNNHPKLLELTDNFIKTLNK